MANWIPWGQAARLQGSAPRGADVRDRRAWGPGTRGISAELTIGRVALRVTRKFGFNKWNACVPVLPTWRTRSKEQQS
jgi:hypothetical protein